MSTIRRWLELDATERRSLAALMLALPLVGALLRVVGYRSTQRWIERRSPLPIARAPSQREMKRAKRLVQLAEIAGRRGPIVTTCLRQSLLVYWLLRRRGLDPKLRLGVREGGVVLDAHAWLELHGRSLETGNPAHRAFRSTPSAK